MSTPEVNQYLAQILGEAKLLEKKLEKATQQKKVVEDRIRTALKAGDRKTAEKFALELEQVKDEETRLQKGIATARAQYEEAKGKAKQVQQNVKSASTLAHTAKALEGLNKAMGLAKDTEDMVRKIAEEAAISEAKLEIAGEEAESHARRAGAEDVEAVKKLTAEQILREFEDGKK